MIGIETIAIVELFGKFNYCLNFENNEKLAILYGDNGSGKTTILQLVFNLLYPVPYSGQFTLIRSKKFKSISIHLKNGYKIEAFRQKATTGAFSVKLIRDNVTIISYEDIGPTNRALESDPNYTNYLRRLSELSLPVEFLTDSRLLDSTRVKRERIDNEVFFSGISTPISMRNENRTDRMNTYLEDALKSVSDLFKNEAIERSAKGQLDTNTIYLNLIEKMTNLSNQDSALTEKETISDFLQLKKRNDEYSKFGLVSDLNTDNFIEILNSSGFKSIDILHSKSINMILKLYLESVVARLDAMTELKNAIDLFVKTINNFFKHKYIRYNPKNGIKIFEESGDELLPEYLSSGEKQLLLIFCHAIQSRQLASIFIIDEPEISLNIKWQRILIDSLVDCSSGGNTQIILASHSMELLSKYHANVVMLESK